MRLLLASRSSARRQMLEAAGVPFEVVETELDEAVVKRTLGGFDAIGTAQTLAEAKARSVAAEAGDLVLGSDQTLEREDGSILDKPVSYEDAREQLRSLAGRTHRLHAAAAIAEAGAVTWRHVETAQLTMRPLSEAFLSVYLDAEYEAVKWSVGAYHVEGRGAQLFERIKGSHFAVLGLPLLPLLAYLRERAVMAS